MGYDKLAYNANYTKTNYDLVRVYVGKGKREALKRYATEHGESVNSLIVKMLERETGLDLANTKD